MNIPVVASVNEFLSALLITFPDLAAIAQPGFSVRYVLEQNNNKKYINSNMELESGVLS